MTLGVRIDARPDVLCSQNQNYFKFSEFVLEDCGEGKQVKYAAKSQRAAAEGGAFISVTWWDAGGRLRDEGLSALL